MKNIKEYSGTAKCCGCGVCSLICKKNAIRMEPDEGGFLQPIINEKICVNCGLCVEKCPINGTVISFEYSEEYFYGFSKDKTKLRMSTSGGVASEMYSSIIDEGGVCYGVKYNSDYLATEYQRAETIGELNGFSGTKYAQADKGRVFEKIKYDLETGKKVLFIGTPCEVAAAKSFLKSDYPLFYTVQLACMGVTSPLVLHDYVTMFNQKEEIRSIIERYTNIDWNYPYFRILYSNGKEKKLKYDSTLYAYGVKTFGRLSCYECKYKGSSRVADITIGDYWGANRDDNYEPLGMSIICVHNKKGRLLIKSLGDKLVLKKINEYDPRKYNPYILNSRKRIKKRETYLKNILEYGFKRGSYKTMSLVEKAKWGIAKIIPITVWSIIYSIMKRNR